MATAVQFKNKKTLGDRAELFVLQAVKRQGLRWLNGAAKEEGSDIAGVELNLTVYGEEAKGIRYFLTRDNGLLPCGDIPFEIMNKDENEQGWLYKWLFPELWMIQHSEEKRPAVKPKKVHYVLYDNDKEKKYPFCFLTFDTHNLFEFLHAAGKEWGWNIFDPIEWAMKRLQGICSMGGRSEIHLSAAGQYIVKGKSDGEETAFCWYVPLSKIISAAEKITMVGDQPTIVKSHRQYEKIHPIPGGDAAFQALQQARYDYLLGHSKGAAITNDELKEIEEKEPIYEQHKILSW